MGHKQAFNFRLKCLEIFIFLVCCMATFSCCCLTASLYLIFIQRRYMDELKMSSDSVLRQLNSVFHELFIITYRNTHCLIEDCSVTMNNFHSVYSHDATLTRWKKILYIPNIFNYQLTNLIQRADILKNNVQNMVPITQSLREQIIQFPTEFSLPESCSDAPNVGGDAFSCTDEMFAQNSATNGYCMPRFICPRILRVIKYPGVYEIPRSPQLLLNGSTLRTGLAVNQNRPVFSFTLPPIEEQWKVRMQRTTSQDLSVLNRFRLSEEHQADADQCGRHQEDVYKALSGQQTNIDARRDERMVVWAQFSQGNPDVVETVVQHMVANVQTTAFETAVQQLATAQANAQQNIFQESNVQHEDDFENDFDAHMEVDDEEVESSGEEADDHQGAEEHGDNHQGVIEHGDNHQGVIEHGDDRQEVVEHGDVRQEMVEHGDDHQGVEEQGDDLQGVEEQGDDRQEVEEQGDDRQEVEEQGGDRQEIEEQGDDRQEVEKHGDDNEDEGDVDDNGAGASGYDSQGADFQGVGKQKVEASKKKRRRRKLSSK